MHRTYARLALCLALALLAALAVPAVASAAPKATTLKPAMVLADEFEPDDTTSTAADVMGFSQHTFVVSYDASGNAVPDIDMIKVTAEDTGTQFVIEASQLAGYFVCDMTAYETQPDTSTLLPIEHSMGVWGFTIGNTMLFEAPHPGTFYVAIEPLLPLNGAYELFVGVGDARRIAGENRYETAAAVSRLMWPNADNPVAHLLGQELVGDIPVGPAGCVIARGDDFADALAGATFAGFPAFDLSSPAAKKGVFMSLGMPVLLTKSDYAPEVTLDEVHRLSQMRLWMTEPFTVYVLGSTTAISDDVIDEIEALNAEEPLAERVRVVRVGGVNRFDTAAKIAALESSSVAGTNDTAFLVNGYSFADALSAAPIASWAQAPILMSRKTSLPAETKAYLLAHPEITNVIIAGTGSTIDTVVASEIETAPLSRTVTRVGGANRYETSRMFADMGVDDFGMNPGAFMVVSGKLFPDGLSAAPLTAFNGGSVMLTPPDVLSEEIIDHYDTYVRTSHPYPLYVIGGTASVSEDAFDELNNLWMAPDAGL